jgi:thiol:disulfide interchange protein DsbD
MKAAFALLFCLSIAAHSQIATRPHLTAELITASHQVRSGDTLLVGVRLKMEMGWHIYWRNPGDSGEQTRLAWELPPGFQAGPILWPAPSRISLPPLVNFGYENEAVLLTEILAGPQGKAAPVLKAHVSWLVCEEICVPGKAELTLPLEWTTGKPTASADGAFLGAQRNHIPSASAKWKSTAEVSEKNLRLVFSGPTDGITHAEFFPFSETLIQNSAEQKFQTGSHSLTLDIPRSTLGESGTLIPAALAGVVVFRGVQNSSLEILPALEATGSEGYPRALLFAFLGGLLLNLMPCVFPVLCLKVLGFAQIGGARRKKQIGHGMAYTLGILVSFWVLAGLLIALRAGGQAIGWGFQLQSPSFLAALSFLLVALSLNLFGVFEIGGGWTGVGQKWAGQEGLPGAFFAGVLATVVATPCTAPFMGTAMGYALGQPPLAALGIFSSLGTGLAAPYLVFSLSPGLTKRLPRPGIWMQVFKQAMAFPLLLTVVWLLSVLAAQTSTETVFQTLAAILFFSVGLWIYGLNDSRRTIPSLLALVFIGLSLYWSLNEIRHTQPKNSQSSAAEGGWEVYSEQALQKARNNGQSVFIDFTAAWCITCQVNERLALSTQPVQDRFKQKNVLLLKADWTNQDEAISKKLESFGRNGVPLYVLYPPGEKSEPRILPQILTPDIVLTALEAF